MKICVFGNSHVAAFKEAEAAIEARHEGVALTCFGAPWPQIDAFTITPEGRFAPDQGRAARAGLRWRGTIRLLREINGSDGIDLAGYDGALLVGRDVRMRDILQMLARTDIDGFASRKRPNLMSRAAFLGMLTDMVAARLPDEFASIAAVTRGAVSIIPCISARCLTDDRPRYDDMRQLAEANADLPALMGAINEVIAARLADLGLAYLPQRPATIRQGFMTDAAHSRGSRRLVGKGDEHDSRDHIHMNAGFAEQCFDEFMTALGTGMVPDAATGIS